MPKLPKRIPALNSRAHQVVLVVGLILLLFAGFGLAQRYKATHNPNPLPPNSVVGSARGGQPDETPLIPGSEAGTKYKTAADAPRVIWLSSINAEGFIQKVGLDTSGAVGVPTNLSMAGWYALEARPGDAGVSLIDGHVQGRYGPGIFKNLSKLKAGDAFSVEFGDASVRQFSVVSVTSYSTNDVAKHMFAKQAGVSKQLNLITCDGAYNKQTQQYENRVLVVSKRVDDR